MLEVFPKIKKKKMLESIKMDIADIQFGGLNDSNVLLGTRGGRNSKL